MAYNNNSYGSRPNYGGRSDYRGGQNRPQQSAPARPAPAEIRPEKLPENYVDRAEAIMGELSQERSNITTSKIRNLLSLVSDIYNVEKLRTDKTLTEESIAKLGMMRVRVAYECGRDGRDSATRLFVEKARLLQYIKGIGTERDSLLHFAHYMEALVAYHRFFGGKEN